MHVIRLTKRPDNSRAAKMDLPLPRYRNLRSQPAASDDRLLPRVENLGPRQVDKTIRCRSEKVANNSRKQQIAGPCTYMPTRAAWTSVLCRPWTIQCGRVCMRENVRRALARLARSWVTTRRSWASRIRQILISPISSRLSGSRR